MNTDTLIEAIGLIDNDLFTEACVAKKNRKKIILKRLAVSAACIILLCAGTIGVIAAVGFDFDKTIQEFFNQMKAAQNNQCIAATVNGAPIYQSAIEMQRISNELDYHTSIYQIEHLDIPQEQKQNYIDKLEAKRNETDSEILNELFENQVLVQQAEKQKIQVSDEEAYNLAVEQYREFKEAALKENANEITVKNYSFLISYIKSMNMTEEDYLKQAANAYKISLMKERLYKNFTEALPDQANQSDIRSKFDDYVKALVTEADIKKY